MPRPPLRLLAVTALVLLPLAACGDGEPAEPASTTPDTKPTGVDLSGKDFQDRSGDAEITVQARDNNFVAPYIEVKAGTKITFVNRGRNQHDVEPVVKGAFPAIPLDAFDPGESKTLTFDEAGEYPYYCTLHGSTTKGMVGAVRVIG